MSSVYETPSTRTLILVTNPPLGSQVRVAPVTPGPRERSLSRQEELRPRLPARRFAPCPQTRGAREGQSADAEPVQRGNLGSCGTEQRCRLVAGSTECAQKHASRPADACFCGDAGRRQLAGA